MSQIVLMEPYRSALSVQAHQEGFASVLGNGSFEQSRSFAIGRAPKLRTQLLELALFYDELVIVDHETEESAQSLQESGYAVLSHKPLIDRRLIKRTNLDATDDKLERYESLKHPSDWWTVEADSILRWRELLISQMMARGKLPSVHLFDDVQIFRTTGYSAYPEALKEALLSYGLNGYGFELVALSTLNEIEEAQAFVQSTSSHITVPDKFSDLLNATFDAEAAGRVQKVVIEQLLDMDLRLPVPETLRDLEILNAGKMLKPFRETFHPWLNAMQAGSADDELRLRKEVRHALKQFRNLPKLKSASKWLSYISLPIGLFPIVGTIIGAAAIAASELADRLEQKTNWVGLCTNVN